MRPHGRGSATASLPPEPDATRGIVFQRYSVFPHLAVEENLIVAAELSASRLGRLWGAERRAARAAARDLIERTGLGSARARYAAQLSGGMQQRVAIGQALSMRPRLLLLDEPFGTLDPGIRADMHELLSELWREAAIKATNLDATNLLMNQNPTEETTHAA